MGRRAGFAKGLLVAAAAIAILAAPLPAVACTKTVRWANHPPYGVRFDDGRLGGYYADLITEALRRMDCEVRFVEISWARGLLALQKGELDIVTGALKIADRGSYARFSQPINFSPNALFLTDRSAASTRVTALSDIEGTSLVIGVVAGVAYRGEYALLQRDPDFRARLRVLTDRRTGWRLLAAGQIDGLLVDEVTGLIEGPDLVPRSMTLRSIRLQGAKPSHFAFSRVRVDEAFVAALDDVITGMIADGTMEAIRGRYVPCPFDARTRGCMEAPMTGPPHPR